MDLVEYIRKHSKPLAPLPTGVSPKLASFEEIKYVVFDIYGTIMISAAGDISLAGGDTAPGAAMEQVFAKLNLSGESPIGLERYNALVQQHQETRRKEGIEFPEIEIREIWSELLSEYGGNPKQAEEAAVIFECAANPVWPMDGFAACLGEIRSRGLGLGVISNAQFYTRLLFPALGGGRLPELGFDPDAMIFSYEMREGKPSRNLYLAMAERLRKKSIDPVQVLYIGNDRLKDIWPARLSGFMTVYFAGDQRSHRWRKDDKRLADVMPDAVITHLNQIVDLIQ